MKKHVRSILIGGWLCFPVIATGAETLDVPASTAQQPPTPSDSISADQDVGKDFADFSLESLLDLPITGAAKHEQKQSEAPADVSVVYAEDIERLGHRTLAEVLWSFRDVFITGDRNYNYLGARGLGIIGDYNSRVLLLIDGRRANDSVYDTAGIALDAPIDLAVIDRVEFIRGASSSLHGSNALLGVINIVTKNPTGKAEAMARVESGVQTSPAGYDSTRGWLQGGHIFDNGAEVLVSLGAAKRKGVKSLYYAEYDDPSTNSGVVKDRDGETYGSLYAKARFREFKLSLGMQGRRKDIPTAAFGQDFNNRSQYTYDGHDFVDLSYDKAFPSEGMMWSTRAFFDRYSYHGVYPYPADPATNTPAILNRDGVTGLSAGLDTVATIRWNIGFPWLTLTTTTLGGELVSRFHLHQENYDENPFTSYVNRTDKNQFIAFYGAQEVRILNQLILNLGMRHDRWLDYHHATSPRLAMIYSPLAKTRIKLIYGTAFRAANAYERFYPVPTGGIIPDVRPERIGSMEAFVEQYFGDHIRAVVSAHSFWLRDAIFSERLDDGTFQSINAGTINGKGISAEVESRFVGGYRLRGSYSIQKTTLEQATLGAAELPNSPRHMVKAEFLAPLPWRSAFVGIEGRHVSSRGTLVTTPNRTSAYTHINATLTARILPNTTGQLLIKNLTNQKYSDPAGEEFLQTQIAHDGMTIWARLSYQK